VVLAQRMESLGTLAGGIAHDFNNILTAIVGHLAIAMQELPRDHPARQRLEVVQGATDRAADLVNQILTFSRRRESRRVPIRLTPVVEEALALLRATLPTMIKFCANLTSDGFDVLADPSQIHQIVMNLGTNAAHAMGSHGTLEVTLEPLTVASGRADVPATLKPGRYMLLTVRDDGSGMDAATLARIFDPFFTTKEPGHGTGLGLSVVHGIVEDHGGTIGVQSRPGEGTTFRIYLPAVQAGVTRDVAAAPLASLRGRGQRILCVDDEQAVLALMLELLSGLDYRPSGFTEPHAALDALRADPSCFDAIVTDFAMPQMTGIELATAAHAMRADLPVFMTSGYLRGDEASDARRAGVLAVLAKPHFVEPLAQALAQLFAGPAGEDAGVRA
jgi:CheY-like chemotaxis protein